MSIEIIILVLCILFGLMLIKFSWVRFRKHQLIRCGLQFGFSLSVLIMASIFAAFIADYNTFQRLTHEHNVANLTFHKLGEHHFQAVLQEPDVEPLFIDIFGDQWQLDARIIKWRGVAAWAGIKPMYRLERIGGRYLDIQKEKNAKRSVYSLGQELSPSLWRFLIEYQEFVPWLDAYYGNATYLPMSHGAKFDIKLSATGLIARAANEPARKSVKYWAVE